MATTLDIGAQASSACPEYLPVAVQGGSVQVKNVTGPTLTTYHGHNQAAPVTTTNGSTTTHTLSTQGSNVVILAPTGRTTVTLTGTGF